jgi:hypothetical protein
VFCGHTFCYFLVVPDHCITDSFFFLETVRVDFGVVFVFFFHQYAGRFLAETFVAGTTSDFAQFEVDCWLVVFIHGGLMHCGVFSILFGSICKFPNDSNARTNSGLGVVGLYSI